MKLTNYGRREWLGLAVLFLLFVAVSILLAVFQISNWLTSVYLSVLFIIIWIALAAFFRDPERAIPDTPTSVVSPADGVVKDIELLKAESVESAEMRELFQDKDILRIGIFLSVLDVHLNRAPADMTISFRYYKKGAFHDARDPRAGRDNESMLIGGAATASGIHFPLAVRQISGALARRIVCPVEPGRELVKGERYGMIKFGSRTEIYLPAGKCFDIKVKVGDRVAGGSTVIADILPVAKEKTLLSESVTEALGKTGTLQLKECVSSADEQQ